jgi:hypothetical protein
MLKRLKCLTTGHSINRNRVWHDRQNYRTRCTTCDTPLIRVRGDWQAFDADEFGLEGRDPHPVRGEVA